VIAVTTDSKSLITSGAENRINSQTCAPQPCVLAQVSLRIIAHGMALPIDFDDQFGCRTVEVDDAAANWVLKPELEPIGPSAEHLPE
jgi:hypothetical protein